MIPISIIFQILIIHFLADFTLQTSEQATLKSTDEKFLLYHVLTYSFCWLFGAYVMFNGDIERSIQFFIMTFTFHYITDYFTSRIGKPFWEKKDLHNGFVVVGFDRVLHYSQLIITYKLLLL